MKRFILFKLVLLTIIFSLSFEGYSQSNKIPTKQEVQAEIDKINNLIKEKGYKWKAGFTSLSFYTKEQLKNLCGDIPHIENTKKSDQDDNSSFQPPNIYNKESKLNNVSVPDWKSYMLPIGSQTACGSNCGNCWAFACSAVAEGLLHQYLGYGIDLDECELTSQACNGCSNGDAHCGFQSLKIQGISSTESSEYFEHGKFKVATYNVQSPTNINIIKQALVYSPVYASMKVYYDFQHIVPGSNYIYRRTSDVFIGDHAVTILGYNDTEEYWICRNSWGTGWGDGGYFKIGYGECGIDETKCGTATVDQSSLAKVVPTLIPDLSTALSYDFGSQEYAYVVANTSLISQPNDIPYDGTVLIKSGAALNLSGYILKATGNMYNEWGSIIIENGGSIIHSAELLNTNSNDIIAYLPDHFSETYTVPYNYFYGYELNVLPNATLYFNNGTNLIVNGTFNADQATFTRSGTSGSWGGIVFNQGSSGSITNCNILYANNGITCNYSLPTISNNTIAYNSTGISLNNIGTDTPEISGNYIHSNSYRGISLYTSSPKIYNNTISSNAIYGIYCYNNCHPYLYNNEISGNSFSGVQATAYNYLYFVPWNSYGYYWGAGYNIIYSNTGKGVNADYNSNLYLGSNPYGGYNSIYGNSSYELSANYQCNIMAEINWWGSYPPSSSEFYAYQSTIDYTPALSYNPSSNMDKPQNPNETTEPVLNKVIQPELLEIALKYQMTGRFDEAIEIYYDFIKKNVDEAQAVYALLMINECYSQSKKAGFDNYLSNRIKQLVKKSNEFAVVVMELENQGLIESGKYSEAIINSQKIKKDHNLNENIDKQTLFNTGFIYLKYLNDVDKAKESFSELAQKYPEDPLTIDSKYLIGEYTTYNLPKNNFEQNAALNKIIPQEFSLTQNYPNPFNPSTTISYSIKDAGFVNIKVFDVIGQVVAELVNEEKQAGAYQIDFNANNLPSGIYIYRIQSGNYNAVKKMILLK